MNKNYILTLTLVLASFLFGNTQILTQDFSGGVASNGWTIDAHAGNWHNGNSDAAGGVAPEARFDWNPQFTGTSRLISPTMDVTASGSRGVMIDFKHLVDHYGPGYNVGVATRSGGGTWNTVWQMAGANVQESRTVLVQNADINTSDFQICFFFTGNSYQINNWHIDDVVVRLVENFDLGINSIDTYKYLSSGNVTIAATLQNRGITPITSFDINYQVDSGSIITESVTGVNIATASKYSYSFTNLWNVIPGNYIVNVSISNINGASDDIAANNQIDKYFYVATQTTTNFPLYEEFTSSTCNPCAGFNTTSMNPFANAHPNDIAVVKYQMNWPAPGDPYYTSEGGVRRSYYMVSVVPSIFIGGDKYATSTPGIEAGLVNENGKDAYFVIDSWFTLDGSNVTVHTSVTPYVTGDFVMHTSVVEKITTQNVVTNGETSFENVMMKMLPNASGTPISAVAETTQSFTLSHDMVSTNVEELNDLAVVVYVQETSGKRIMQSKYVATATPLATDNFVLNAVSVYPNPTKGMLHINTENVLNFNITNVLGKIVVANKTINENTNLDISNLENGIYFVNLTDGSSKVTKKIVLSK